MTRSEEVIAYMDHRLATEAFNDDPRAWNGLQVEGRRELNRVACAVDASEVVLARAVAQNVDLLLVHHGLFWDPDRRITDRRLRKLQLALDHGLWVYSSHLPLDAHPELGNAAQLLLSIGIQPNEPFGSWKGQSLGWMGTGAFATPQALEVRLSEAVGDTVRTVWGPDGSAPETLAVVTGAGASFLEEARARGVDTLITGEAPHHAFFDARELGVRLVLAGHHRTETFGVRALAAEISTKFELEWSFFDDPSGL